MSSDITDTQLQMLSKRWAEDPTPHLALQLADVYRQRGQLEEALPILERGLEAHPDHVSIQVALGRYRLDAGDTEGAASVLLSVVDKDPGHLVANKLLVRAHLGLGDRKSAADRLELYALLNDNDPDLETLRDSLLAESPPAPAGTTTDNAEPLQLPEVFAEAAAPVGPDLASLPRRGRRSVTGALDRDPFADLGTPPQLASLPGFLQREDPVAAEEPEPAAESREEPAPEPELAAQDPEVVVEESAPEEPPAEVEESSPAIELPEPAEAMPSEAPEPVIEPATEALEPVVPEPSITERSGPTEIEEGAGATATLGALYLSQGHLADARRTFEQVLERDPADREASAGLAEVERKSGADRAVEEATATASDDPKDARIAPLERYLSRIRAAAERLSA